MKPDTLGVFILLSLLLVGSSAAGAVTLPPEFTATYDVKKGFFKIGKAVRKLRKTDDKWTYTSDSRTTGLIGSLFSEHIIQTTEFDLKNGVIRPLSYQYDRNKGEKTVQQTFDWQHNQVLSQRDDKESLYDIPQKVQDQSIYQLSLMLDLANGSGDLVYHVAENVRLVDYTIKYLGKERVKSRLGKFDTLAVEVKTKKNKTTIWCAPKLHYLPIKIEFEEGGTTFVAWLKEIEGF